MTPYGGQRKERHDILAMMAKLKLLGMHLAFDEGLVRELAISTFYSQQRNPVLAGGTGTGKSHLVVVIARICRCMDDPAEDVTSNASPFARLSWHPGRAVGSCAMLVQEGETRSSEADRHLAWSLAGIAGALNSAGFYAVGLYSSNMTGNVSALADHLGMGDLTVAATYLALVATFILGAAVSTLLVNAGRRRGLAGIYAFSILAEAILLAGLGCADLWRPEIGRGPVLAFGLSFLMGLQNAVVTRLSNARVRTTHITGMVTDIGIELGNLVDLAGRRGHEEIVSLNKDKLRLHGQTVASFLAGGIVGVLAYKRFGAFLLLGAAALLLLLASRGIVAGWAGSYRSVPPRD